MTEPPQCIPFDRLVPIFLRSQGGKSYGDGDLDASRCAAIELRDMLRDRGWALISLGDSVASDKITRDHGRVLSAQRREELVDSLFDGDVAAVQGSCPIDSNNELGVREHVELGKRSFAYRRGSERFPDVETSNLSQLEVFDDQQALTSPSPLFERRVKELWRSCEYVSRVVLAAVADSLRVEPKLLLDLCSLPSKEYESNCEGERDESMLHLFDYYSPPSEQMAMNLGCPEHTDSGLITCIPASSNGAGLECLDWQSFEVSGEHICCCCCCCAGVLAYFFRLRSVLKC